MKIIFQVFFTKDHVDLDTSLLFLLQGIVPLVDRNRKACGEKGLRNTNQINLTSRMF